MGLFQQKNMVQALDMKIDMQLEESTCFKKALLISDAQ